MRRSPVREQPAEAGSTLATRNALRVHADAPSQIGRHSSFRVSMSSAPCGSASTSVAAARASSSRGHHPRTTKDEVGVGGHRAIAVAGPTLEPATSGVVDSGFPVIL